MRPEKIAPVDTVAIEAISDQCSRVAMDCAEVGGLLDQVNATSADLRDEHVRLLETFAALEADQHRVTEAGDEARLLSQQAIERLAEGTRSIGESLAQINTVFSLVDVLARHLTGFSAAMVQVERCAKGIERVAETTSILALNATIEAMRAGKAGNAFELVAEEVKALAADTREATTEITQTIARLGSEAAIVSGRIEAGTRINEEAKASIAGIESAIRNVSELVGEVDSQNDQIARATGTISEHVGKVQTVLANFEVAASSNEQRLASSIQRMGILETAGSEMFDAIVRGGLSAIDLEMVEVALEHVGELVEITEQALASGELTRAALFDADYREIPGSNPARYTTGLTHWADRNWRPVIDRCLARGRPIKMFMPADMQGFMPTHATERSRPQTGNLAHDTAFCRNGRIIFGPSEQRARASNRPFLMAVHRQNGNDGSFYIVRTVYVPLVIQGERWGDAELAYILDDAAWPKQ